MIASFISLYTDTPPFRKKKITKQNQKTPLNLKQIPKSIENISKPTKQRKVRFECELAFCYLRARAAHGLLLSAFVSQPWELKARPCWCVHGRFPPFQCVLCNLKMQNSLSARWWFVRSWGLSAAKGSWGGWLYSWWGQVFSPCCPLKNSDNCSFNCIYKFVSTKATAFLTFITHYFSMNPKM